MMQSSTKRIVPEPMNIFLGVTGFLVGTPVSMTHRRRCTFIYIIYEIFAGEASKINSSEGTKASKSAFNALRWIVTVGWAIYPLGYILGYAGMLEGDGTLNLIYNLADFVNKIAFGVVIWAAATSDESRA